MLYMHEIKKKKKKEESDQWKEGDMCLGSHPLLSRVVFQMAISYPKHAVGLVGVLSTAAQNAPKAQTLPQLSGFESGIYMMPCSGRERYVYRKFGKF